MQDRMRLNSGTISFTKAGNGPALLLHAITVEIADAGHYPHETAPAQLLSALQPFLAATQPYRYMEDRWVRRLVCARPTGAGLGPPGKTPTTDEVVTH